MSYFFSKLEECIRAAYVAERASGEFYLHDASSSAVGGAGAGGAGGGRWSSIIDCFYVGGCGVGQC